MNAYQPLVSVVVPCYNHGAFLGEAIESVQAQTYPSIEIIVVDDGSTDNTRTVVGQFPGVKYVYQNNQGLSAARNTGVKNSAGEFLVFLDADDLLYPNAIACNVGYMLEQHGIAFVSGAHDVVSVDKKKIGEKAQVVTGDHYLTFLKGNYIGMHATVLYRRSVFDEFMFDETLKSCEDYDLYLKIARRYPVLHHTEKLTAYRMHGTNMSWNPTLMLHQILHVLKRQQSFLANEKERNAYRKGIRFYKFYYTVQLFNFLRKRGADAPKESVAILRRYNKYLYLRYMLRRMAPSFGMRLLNKL